MLRKKVVRKSLCPCRYPTGIKVGEEFKIPVNNAVGELDLWVCGGCGREKQIEVIMVYRFGKIEWLPKELFDWNETSLEEASPGAGGLQNPS